MLSRSQLVATVRVARPQLVVAQEALHGTSVTGLKVEVVGAEVRGGGMVRGPWKQGRQG